MPLVSYDQKVVVPLKCNKCDYTFAFFKWKFMQKQILKICNIIEGLAMLNIELSTNSSKIHSIAMLVDAELMKRMKKWNELEKDKTIVGYIRGECK